MYKIFLAIVIIAFLYIHFSKRKVIEIDPSIEKMKNLTFTHENNNYKLRQVFK